MKKFFTLLCMALLSAVGFAQDAYDPSEHEVYLRGTDNFCSEYWAEGTSQGKADPMSYDSESGKWTITKNATVTNQTIEIQVTDVTGGLENWYGKDGLNSGNVQFSVSEACDVTVTFDPIEEKIEVSGSAVGGPITGIEYIVATGSKGLFGVEWKVKLEEAAANQMIEVDDDYYELVLNDISAGSYEFKFAANGAWAIQWGSGEQAELTNNVAVAASDNGGNFKITLPKGATYKVTLTLDLMAETPYVTAKWEEAGVAPVEPDVYSIAGTCNSWNQLDESTEMTEVSAGVYSITIPMQAGEQKFKVVVNHDWAVAYPASDYVFELEEDANVTITINMNEDGNITIATAPCTVYFIKVNVQTTKEAVNLYAAETDSWTQLTGAWPGAAMNAMEGGFTYTVKLTKGEKLWLIFNGEGGQTENIEVDGIGMSRTLDFILSDDWSFERGTAIQGIEAAKQNGAIYNLAGQRVEKAVRGIYVINGRKVVK